MTKIPAEYVDQYYKQDPKSEDFLRGDQLENGMVVLVTNDTFRVDLKKPFVFSPRDESQRNIYNRWCGVTDLKRLPNNVVSFVGVYADGTRYDRTWNKDQSWFVKKDVPETKEIVTSTFDDLVTEWADVLGQIYDDRTAGDFTFKGVLYSFLSQVAAHDEDSDPELEPEIPGPVLIAMKDWPVVGITTQDLKRKNRDAYVFHREYNTLLGGYYELSDEAIERLGFTK